ncbi:hypothetical protein J1605_023006 [Eschrichtius robustus]|uniref:Uncharacterized protein n=1 Tax=Eschrichtius robustus TaxID=9764 RepID=A0AB34H905_ESCRO|nr:hypothetical protein J1605_023006 [Eschrichtius robustus]
MDKPPELRDIPARHLSPPLSSLGLSHFLSPRPPRPGARTSAGSRPLPPGTQRRRIPVGPRSAKSAQRDGKLQKSSALCPPPRLSRNSRPWARAPQLIHSPGAGPALHVHTRARPRLAPGRQPRRRLSPARGAFRPRGEYPPDRPSRSPPRAPPPSVALPTDGPGWRREESDPFAGPSRLDAARSSHVFSPARRRRGPAFALVRGSLCSETVL